MKKARNHRSPLGKCFGGASHEFGVKRDSNAIAAGVKLDTRTADISSFHCYPGCSCSISSRISSDASISSLRYLIPDLETALGSSRGGNLNVAVDDVSMVMRTFRDNDSEFNDSATRVGRGGCSATGRFRLI